MLHGHYQDVQRVYRLLFLFSILPGAGVSWHPTTPQTSIRQIADARLSTIAMIGLATMHLVTLLAAILTRIRTCRWQCQSAVFLQGEKERERSRGFISGNGLQEPLRKAPPHAGVHQLLSVCNWRFSRAARCRPESMSTIDILTGVYNNY